MDSVREQIEVANEISGAISNPINMGIDIDQDELQNELDELEQEQLNDKLMGAERAPVHAPGPKLTHGEQRERESTQPLGEVKVRLTFFARAQTLPDLKKRTTKKHSFVNCRPRWPCNGALSERKRVFIAFCTVYNPGRGGGCAADFRRLRCHHSSRTDPPACCTILVVSHECEVSFLTHLIYNSHRTAAISYMMT